MKQFFKRLSLFAVFAFLLYIIAVVLFGSYAPKRLKKNFKYPLGGNGHLFTRIREADTVKNVDVLIIGSSHAYRSYDPRIFAHNGYKMFNLGSSSQSFVQTEALLKSYIDRIKPKYIIFDIYPLLFQSEGIESALDIVTNAHPDSHISPMALKLANPVVNNALIYSYYRELSGLNKTFKESPKRDMDLYIPGGFVQSFKIYKVKPLKNKRVESYEFHKDQVAALKNILTLLKDKNIPFTMIQSPLPVKEYAFIKNNHSVDSLFKGLGDYVDYNKVLKLPDTLFSDHNHLNQYGVNIFDDKVLIALKSKFTPKAKHSID